MQVKEIQKILKEAGSIDDFKKLFIEVLNFKRIQNDFVNIPENIKDLILDSKIIAEFNPIFVFYFKLNLDFDNNLNSERNIRSKERIIIKEIIKIYRQNHLFIFSDNKNIYWDFVYPFKYGNRLQLKRFNINPDNRDKLRTPSEQLCFLINNDDEESIFEKLEKTFNTEAVSEKFYKDYIIVFNKIKNEFKKQFNNEEKIHWFTHQLLNRLMFLYFVQKRGVFNGNRNFLAFFWNSYRNFYENKDEFYDKWLKVLFFEALNGNFTKKDYLKLNEEIDFNKILFMAPHLNGGLFKENPEFDFIDIKVKDNLFIEIFDFLESYNFTARESTPLDEDLEIDPEMLGNIYEMIVNVSDSPEEDERHKAGIFYTPKIEIDLMIKRSLVEFLYNKTSINKEKLYQFIFPEIEEEVIPDFSEQEIKKIYEELDNITIVDPACGSGHYLVVAMEIIFELKKILWKKLGNTEESFNAFNEKLKIIEKSIFGVDIKDWAVEIAKLRLWLDLMVSAKDEDFVSGGKALLPNLAFKIRVGDSLLQEIAGTFFRVREIEDIPPSLRALKNQVIEAKKEYFYNKKPEQWVRSKENEFFRALIDEKINNLKNQKNEIQKKFLNIQVLNFDKENTQELKDQLSVKDKEELESIGEKIKILEEEKQKISLKSKFAFWPIEFAEILSGEKNGFDIVIANPPYVRQEKIEDLIGGRPKNEYKTKLIEQIKKDWEISKFGRQSPLPKKFDNRSDLYIYFYLKGLKLLNPDGILCYISSNSWLDVGFGRVLQEVLIKRCPIVAIYDNQVKRSFKHADVNTIIALIKAPKERDFDEEIKNNEVRFVMFKKPFEEIMYSEIFIDLEKNYDLKEFQEGKRRENEIYRLHIVNQKDLWEFGKDEKTGEYVGNKWGGKYLRAPEIYWKILEKGKGKLVRLGDIAEVRFGIKTGANEFFYVEDVTDKIKDE